MPADQPSLYLTFDDGPVPGPTEFVLEELQKYRAKATFFCIGDNIRKYPEVFNKVVAQGHAVGNHTFHHLNGWKTSADKYRENIQLCDQEMIAAVDSSYQAKGTILFRPPYGRITREQIRALKSHQIIMWDVLSIDYDSSLSPEQCLKNTIKATRPGSIIVFHDSIKAERNMTFALPRFLEHFSALGFTFKALPASP